MTRPSIGQARTWRPNALRRLADSWDETARVIHGYLVDGPSPAAWSGATGDEARQHAADIAADGDAVARALVLAAVAARDGADQIATAQTAVMARVDTAHDEGFLVRDDGSAEPNAAPSPLAVLLVGGDEAVIATMQATRGAELTRQITDALDALGAADDDAARDVLAATSTVDQRTDPALGNSDAVDWDVRIAANRTTIAQAVVEGLGDPATERGTFYRGLLGEIDDPAGSGRRIDRKILAFDPAHDTLIELNGDLASATSVAVLVPGMNTTVEGSAGTTRSARHFVAATRGEVAAITYLGGPFPGDHDPITAIAEAASPRFAMAMAPRLVSFSRAVDAAVDATGRRVAVTYVGHSYGGSILGTAEALGMTADRTLYAAAAGTGFGVDHPDEWHNRNPHVLRFSMTAPGDPIQLVQGIIGGPHGADPDDMPGVIHLATGRYDDGRLMAGPAAHGDVLSVEGSDAWRNVLAVITGDRQHIVLAG